MEKANEELNNNITKVSKTLDGIGEVMKQCVGILSNIAAPHMYNYHLQMPQGPYMTYLNESAINEQGTRQNEKLQSTMIVFYKDIQILPRLLTVVAVA